MPEKLRENKVKIEIPTGELDKWRKVYAEAGFAPKEIEEQLEFLNPELRKKKEYREDVQKYDELVQKLGMLKMDIIHLETAIKETTDETEKAEYEKQKAERLQQVKSLGQILKRIGEVLFLDKQK